MIQKQFTEEKLYESDAYLFVFSARVTAIFTETDGTQSFVLDKTAFFPEGGGQVSDTGVVGGVRVLAVKETVAGVKHKTGETSLPFSVGDTVEGRVDVERRLELMRHHTGEHIVSGLLASLFGYENVGFHLSDREMTLDTSGPLTAEQIGAVESAANAAIRRNLPVNVSYPSAEELANLTYRSKLALQDGVRLVEILGVDVCACCAPHVRFTGEIGLVKILFAEKHKNGMRLYVAAGERAFRELSAVYEAAGEVGCALSVKRNEIAPAVDKLAKDLANAKFSLREAELTRMRTRAQAFLPKIPYPVVVLPEADAEMARTFANIAVKAVAGALLLLLPKPDGNFSYLLASDKEDVRPLAKALNEAAAGKGGGSSSMVQGTLCAKEADVRAFFENTQT